MSIRRVRHWNLLKNLGSWSTARDAGHWLIMCFSSPSVGPTADRHSGVLVRCLVSWTTLVVQVGRYVVDPALNLDPEHFQLVFCVLAGQVWGRSIQKEIHGNMAKQD